MADNDDFDRGHVAGGRFSQLFFSDDVVGLGTDDTFKYSPCFSAEKPPKMLCFGNYEDKCEVGYTETTRTTPKSGVTCSDSSSASSSNNNNNSSSSSSVNILSKSNKKRNESGQESVHCSSPGSGAGGPVESQGNCKKSKAATATSAGHAKVRKEKLGERITALQQLVSPYGKTDTASVLHEAMGYIRFLHDQVQVLCSPYLQRLPSAGHLPEGGENQESESRKDLRSRGLCLVPVACTAHVADSNGADFWSPTMGDVSSKH